MDLLSHDGYLGGKEWGLKVGSHGFAHGLLDSVYYLKKEFVVREIRLNV